MKQLSWKPTSQGDIYCSPACGGGCTKVAYAQARQNAKKLRGQLGREWIFNVWENLGWYYQAVSPDGNIKVSPHMINGYMVFLADRWVGDGKTPKSAVKNVIARAEREVAELNAILESARALKHKKVRKCPRN